MKQEKLMSAMNDLDDALIEKAAPRGRRRAKMLWASFGAAAACFILGFSVSLFLLPWLPVQADDVPYADSVPEMIFVEDLDAVFEVIRQHPDMSKNQMNRLIAFFERIELTEGMPDKRRQVMMKEYPIVEYGAIYVLEPTITELERKWVDATLQMYGGYTVDDMIADVEHINQVAVENGLEPIEYSSKR